MCMKSGSVALKSRTSVGDVVHRHRQRFLGRRHRLVVPLDRQHRNIVAARRRRGVSASVINSGNACRMSLPSSPISSWRCVSGPQNPSEHSSTTSFCARRACAVGSTRGARGPPRHCSSLLRSGCVAAASSRIRAGVDQHLHRRVVAGARHDPPVADDVEARIADERPEGIAVLHQAGDHGGARRTPARAPAAASGAGSWRARGRWRGSRKCVRIGDLRLGLVLKALPRQSTAICAATSPCACPPMPSATTRNSASLVCQCAMRSCW